ncbi:hypothetical protein BpHYR1_011648 [Brachionus plicatilis]|uniref:Uncharacterized protein n=1 Tax=Brachionus plicatilis TaxID=10195 RepID=A0A3M7PCS0_BRAPC|nr:hypothetical protein BpHYR1_011648 [Brachionus plicatilis]
MAFWKFFSGCRVLKAKNLSFYTQKKDYHNQTNKDEDELVEDVIDVGTGVEVAKENKRVETMSKIIKGTKKIWIFLHEINYYLCEQEIVTFI